MAIPKLNLRDLFWLTVVVALAVGWWTESQKNARLDGRLRAMEHHGNIANSGPEDLQRWEAAVKAQPSGTLPADDPFKDQPNVTLPADDPFR